MESKLPEGWKIKNLVKHIPIVKTGVKEYKGEKSYYSTGAVANASTYSPEGYYTFKNKPSRANRLAIKGDVVQARMQETKKALLIDDNLDGSLLSTGFLQFRPTLSNYDCKLFYHYLCSDLFLKQRDEFASGSTQIALTDKGAKNIDLIIPPDSEQKRIADKLDVLLAKVKYAQSRLDKIPLILKRFRKSVLAAAFSGELTKEWREHNQDVNAIYDCNFIKNFLIQSNVSSREKKQIQRIYDFCTDAYQYDFPVPLSWLVSCVGRIGLINNGSTPSRKVSEYWKGSIPWISSGEVHNNIISESREKITQKGLDDCSSKLFSSGTVLIAMIGEGKTRGQSAILNIDAAINQNVAAIQISHGRINPEYFWFWFQFQYENNRNYGSGSGPQALNCQRVRELPFVLAPKEEQDEIIKKIKLSFMQLDKFAERYKKAKRFTDKLEQSILAKAFRGELVMQKPNNDPENECDDK